MRQNIYATGGQELVVEHTCVGQDIYRRWFLKERYDSRPTQREKGEWLRESGPYSARSVKNSYTPGYCTRVIVRKLYYPIFQLVTKVACFMAQTVLRTARGLEIGEWMERGAGWGAAIQHVPTLGYDSGSCRWCLRVAFWCCRSSLPCRRIALCRYITGWSHRS